MTAQSAAVSGNMKIKLIQIDGTVPNLALMKLSHYYKERKGAEVTFTRSVNTDMFENYDLEGAMNKPEFIVCSAVWYQDGEKRVHSPRNVESGLVVYGVGHHHCFALLGEMFPDRRYLAHTEDGFMTSHLRFVDRIEGKEIAKREGQMNCELERTELFSENIFY